ncbi:hypothetical protein KO528_07485 [Saccharophagus degradans]|uniref:hypothetical protein n=1 Tax=Saccharophagus degradans TaxID=86304 RepID=UPI001C090C64|nr:hypothetical protein [Saccharophagus degradans]MBU2985188.1 hypothetical protein [Saccharophagus degradans]
MDFESQSIEMKRTMLEASVGRVAIAAHSLELHAKLLLCIEIAKGNDTIFEEEFEKFRTLGMLVQDIGKAGLLNNPDMDTLRLVKNSRNEFTHKLSEPYITAIRGDKPMYELILEFEGLKCALNDAEKVISSILNVKAKAGGVSISDVKQKAKEEVNNWEKPNN